MANYIKYTQVGSDGSSQDLPAQAGATGATILVHGQISFSLDGRDAPDGKGIHDCIIQLGSPGQLEGFRFRGYGAVLEVHYFNTGANLPFTVSGIPSSQPDHSELFEEIISKLEKINETLVEGLTVPTF